MQTGSAAHFVAQEVYWLSAHTAGPSTSAQQALQGRQDQPARVLQHAPGTGAVPEAVEAGAAVGLDVAVVVVPVDGAGDGSAVGAAACGAGEGAAVSSRNCQTQHTVRWQPAGTSSSHLLRIRIKRVPICDHAADVACFCCMGLPFNHIDKPARVIGQSQDERQNGGTCARSGGTAGSRSMRGC
jgi:hypothetical protein